VLFLAEAALGQEHSIVRDDPSLVSPPKGGPLTVLDLLWGAVCHSCAMWLCLLLSRPCQSAISRLAHPTAR
jgi:hypothetical protein